MIPVTLGSEDFFLWPFGPNYRRSGPSGTFAFPSETYASPKGNELRSPYGSSLRMPSYRFDPVLTSSQAADLEDWLLLDLTVERLLVPIWGFARAPGEFAAAGVSAKWQVTYEALPSGFPAMDAGFEVHEGPAAAGSFSSHARTAPLLPCRWKERPSPSMLTDQVGQLTASFEEDCSADEGLVLDARDYADGPQLADETPAKLFPFDHDYSRAASSGGSSLLIEFLDPIGSGSRKEVVYLGAYANRESRLTASLLGPDAVPRLLRFFADRKGSVEPFWIPTFVGRSKVLQPAASGSEEIEVADHTKFGRQEYLHIRQAGSSQIVEVLSASGGTLTLASPGLSAAIVPGMCSLSNLVYSVFAKESIEVRWLTDKAGTAVVETREVSSEYVPDEDEVRGETVGGTLPVASLYRMTSAGLEWHYTDFGSAVDFGGDTYLPIDIFHGDVFRGNRMEMNGQITASLRQCVPFKLLRDRMLRSLSVEVFKGKVGEAGLQDELLVLTGRMEAMKPVEKIRMQGDCVFLGYQRKKALPRLEHARGCRHATYNAGCTLSRAAWEFSATITDAGAAGWPFEIVVNSIARVAGGVVPTFFAGKLSGGKAWVSDGVGLKSCMISGNTQPVSGSMTLTLSRDLDPFPADSDTIYFRPSCHGTKTDCAWFGNIANYSGIDQARANLSGVRPEAAPSSSKK